MRANKLFLRCDGALEHVENSLRIADDGKSAAWKKKDRLSSFSAKLRSMPESHEDLARCSMARNDHDHSQGRHALRISSELAAKRTASLKTGRNLRSLRSEPLTTSDGRLMTDLRGSQPTSSTQIGFCHMALNFKVT